MGVSYRPITVSLSVQRYSMYFEQDDVYKRYIPLFNLSVRGQDIYIVVYELEIVKTK